MSKDLIQQRLEKYQPKNQLEELRALKEIVQEITLAALARADFFRYAQFLGGTCLRILHGLPRFSEDLDFSLNESDPRFNWNAYERELQEDFDGFGLRVQIQDRSKAVNAVKKAFLKEDSFGQVLTLQYPRTRADIQKIVIKLEVDTNPPHGSVQKSQFVNFPYPYSVVSQDLPSLFAGKCHALLCRTFVKGRDWFDFIWYVTNGTTINYNFLGNALHQIGPWEGKKPAVDKAWVKKELQRKIREIDWNVARQDVMPLVEQQVLQGLSAWSVDLFDAMVLKL